MRRMSARALVPLAVSLATVGVLISIRGRLPDPLAIHYGAGGVADGYASSEAVIWYGSVVLLVLTIAMTLLSFVGGRQMVGSRALAGAPLGVTTLLATLLTVTVVDQIDLPSSVNHRMPGWTVAVPLAAGAVGWVLGALIDGPEPEVPPGALSSDPALPRYDLGGTGTVVWQGTAAPGVALVILSCVVLAVVTAVALLVDPWLFLVVGVVLAAILSTILFRVTVGRSAVLISGGLLGLPRFRVPLDRVVAARAVSTSARSWGGWGLRVMPNRTGIITRHGPALEIERSDGARLLVTVERPDEAAGVVNALLARDAVG